jgi:transcriptional regulator with XRE-family HTH domain
MDNFKKNIELITSDQPSEWRKRSLERISKPWLKHYSSQIARRVLALIEGDRELNQSRLAQTLGVSAQQISKIVSGKENMTLETIYKLSKALNSELLTFPPYKYSRPEKKTPIYSLTIDSETHLVSQEMKDDIYSILAQEAKSGGNVSQDISSFQSLSTEKLRSMA